MGIGDRLKGAAQEAGGKIKEAVGNATNDERLVGEGLNDQTEGQARQDVARVGEHVGGTADQVSGRVKSTAGAMTGDNSTELKGKVQELKGDLRKKINK